LPIERPTEFDLVINLMTCISQRFAGNGIFGSAECRLPLARGPAVQYVLRYLCLAAVAMMAGATLFAVDSTALANFMSGNADVSFALSALHSAVGDHHGVLRIEVDRKAHTRL
jgi:hypothetical protein